MPSSISSASRLAFFDSFIISQQSQRQPSAGGGRVSNRFAVSTAGCGLLGPSICHGHRLAGKITRLARAANLGTNLNRVQHAYRATVTASLFRLLHENVSRRLFQLKSMLRVAASFRSSLSLSVALASARRFSRTNDSSSINKPIIGSAEFRFANINATTSTTASVGQMSSSITSTNNHLVQFTLCSPASARLDFAIVSHFRSSDSSRSVIGKSAANFVSIEPITPVVSAVQFAGRPPRGREGRQQHNAKRVDTVKKSAAAVHSPGPELVKNLSEESRRKAYELRRAERDRIREEEINSKVSRISQDDFEVTREEEEEDEVCATVTEENMSESLSVNKRDFEYFMNVTSSLASRQRVSQMIEDGLVYVNGSPILCKSHVLAKGIHNISVSLPFGSPNSEVPIKMASPFPVLYEDDVLLVISKPPGIIVHPSPSNQGVDSPSVVSRLLEHGFSLPATQLAIHRAGLVHRLDRDTSGCLLIAKTHLALASLSKQFADRSVIKRYLAVVHGTPGHVVFRSRISSSQHLASGRDRRARVAVPADASHGKSAVTAVSTLSSSRELSVVEALIGTGRTHQIRVHLSSAGFPVFGDTLYGSSGTILDNIQFKGAVTSSRPMLHAQSLVFKHPVSLREMTVSAPVPEDMLSLLSKLAPSLYPSTLK